MSAPSYREATLADIPELMAIRKSVRDNVLIYTVLTPADYERAMTVDGRAWVCELDGLPIGFVCGRTVQRDIWALFLREAHEGKGIGSALMQIVEEWLFGTGLDEIRLVTSPGTRAEHLYRRRGYVEYDVSAAGEIVFALRRPSPQ